ncbi:virginiamycin B lyase family protein [Nonomuraea longicatena]|uniref:Virginiamycin B lyase n=1 Tax=Nonomuraea longicatena TaxID=83682 RepID=A0ABP3ZIU7_9ACTN
MTDIRIEEHRLCGPESGPYGLTTGPDGHLWFTEWGANRVGSIGSDSDIEVHPLPTPDSQPHGIALGLDGALWTALEIGALGRVSRVRDPGGAS